VGGAWHEHSAPVIVKATEFPASLRTRDVLTGDVDDALHAAAQRAGARVLMPPAHRVVALTRVGARLLSEERIDDAAALVPLYLRAPSIGPQT
jgi:hypothetical protein